MKTVRRPPYPKWNPGYFPCSSLIPLPLSSRRPSVSFGGFGLRRKEQQDLDDVEGGGKPPWNKLTSQEIDYVLSAAREMPALSCRQLAAWATDNMGFSVSESTVYRILRREGLVKRPEMRLAAGKEYHRKTTDPH